MGEGDALLDAEFMRLGGLLTLEPVPCEEPVKRYP